MTIWVDKVNWVMSVGVRRWWMEKFPGHGLWYGFPAARPAGPRTSYPQLRSQFLFQLLYPPVPFLKMGHWSLFQ